VKRNGDHRGTNGHARSGERANGKAHGAHGGAGHANGYDSASLERGGLSARGEQAASDDERGDLANGAANSSATRANRESTADAAASPRSGKNTGTDKNEKSKKNEQIEFPGPTDTAALKDCSAFACSVAEAVDLIKVSKSLLQSTDEKIRKAELDRVRDMQFGKLGAGAAPAEESFAVDWTGVPRPPR
jgi:hypothetical protein